MNKKSALEQALLESEEIVMTVTKNAKDMLYNQIKSGISKNITEGFEDLANKDNEDNEDDVEVPAVADTEIDSPEGEEEIVTDEPVAVDSPEGEIDPLGDEPSIDGEVAVEVPAIDGDDDVMDMTGASDEELISIWKKMGDDAEIQVVKNEDNSVNITTPQGEEFLIKINENEDKMIEEEFAQFGDEPADDKYSFVDKIQGGDNSPEGNLYEIELDDKGENTPAPILEEEPIEEVARTHADGRKMERKPEGFYQYAKSRLRPAETVNENSVTTKVLISEAEQKLITEKAELVNENKNLKSDLDKHKDTLRLLKENLEKVAIFNSKLAYVNKIFCEHATTNDEKRTILERFDADEIVTSKDVQTLYKTISTEMKKTIKESVEVKLNSNTLSGTGETLLESVVSPEKSALDARLERVKEIMKYQTSGR